MSFPNPDVKAQVAFANQFSTAKVGLVESGTEKGNYGDGGERGYLHFKLDRCRLRQVLLYLWYKIKRADKAIFATYVSGAYLAGAVSIPFNITYTCCLLIGAVIVHVLVCTIHADRQNLCLAEDRKCRPECCYLNLIDSSGNFSRAADICIICYISIAGPS